MVRILSFYFAGFCLLALSGCTNNFESTLQSAKPQEVLSDGDVHYEAVDEMGVFVEHKEMQDPMAATYQAGPIKKSAAAKYSTILNSGSPANRVDIVLVGDGYTTNNLGQYEDDAESVSEKFLGQEPLLTYSSYINVHRVDVISSQSGVDQDPKGTTKNTALGMGFWCSNTERLLCANMQKVKEYAANAPDVDVILAIANSSKYGGAGYWKDGVATLPGRNASAVELALHEIGHSFALLGDEYSYAGSSSSECAAKANGSTTNATKILASKTKWWRWLDLPHIGSFEGTCYQTSGIFRPTLDSKMRTLGKPFYEVNTEQYIFAIYKHVRPIDAATAAGTYKQGAVLNVKVMKPINHKLSIQWYLDGVVIPNQTDENLDTSRLVLTKDSHKISVQVIDKTTRVRDEAKRASLMTDSRQWTLQK